MITNAAFGVLFGTLLLINTVPDVASYSKYGRTCKDIGCRSDEECVMAEDPCTRYSQNNCGSYPTCRKAHAGEASCTSIVCAENEYCRSENGVPKCVQKTTGIAYPTRRPTHNMPYPNVPTPPSTNSYGGRNRGYSGQRNTIGDGSIWNRLFGDVRDDRTRGYTTSRPRTQQGGNGYYDTHTSVDNHGNRVWTFSG